MGICPHHCPPEGGVLVKAAAITAGAVLGWAALRVAASAAEAVALAILSVCALGVPVVAYLVVHGRVPVRRAVAAAPAQAALPRGTQLALEARQVVPGVVIAATTGRRSRTRATRSGR